MKQQLTEKAVAYGFIIGYGAFAAGFAYLAEKACEKALDGVRADVADKRKNLQAKGSQGYSEAIKKDSRTTPYNAR